MRLIRIITDLTTKMTLSNEISNLKLASETLKGKIESVNSKLASSSSYTYISYTITTDRLFPNEPIDPLTNGGLNFIN